jgi:outer membrane protein TolC
MPAIPTPNPRLARPVLLAMLACALTSVSLQAQVSLATVVDFAERNSTTIRLAEADVEKAQATLAQTHDAFIPSVELGAGLPAAPAIGFTGGVPSIVTGSMQSLVVSLPQIQYIKAAKAGLEAARLNLKNAREQVAFDASTAYVELDTVNKELETASQEEAFANRLVEIEQQRTESGVDPLSELLQAQLTSAELELHRIRLESRAAYLDKQLATLTGMPLHSIAPESASIPEIPAVDANKPEHTPYGVQAAQMLAVSKQKSAKGDRYAQLFPQMSFSALYLRNTTILNNFNQYYNPYHPIPTNNFSSGFNVEIPIFNWGKGDAARKSNADALRATVESEEAANQNDLQIASLTGNLRELDTLARIAGLKQQISQEQLKAVLAQLENGNGATGPGSTPQLTPKNEQLARIDERQKYEDSLDASLELAKARLGLLRALGHMEDWLQELHQK